jgi:hypothetical protein
MCHRPLGDPSGRRLRCARIEERAVTSYPRAEQRPGPAGKVYAGTNAIEGIVLHSMVGSLGGAFTVLDDESLTAHSTYRAASWHFSVARDGAVYQHYPLEACSFHAGSGIQNRRLIGVEHEGGPPGNVSEPLTEAQLAASIDLALWIADRGGFVLSRGSGPVGPAPRTLFEHRELAATLCPSGRFDAVWGRYTQPRVADPVAPGPVPLPQLTSYRGFDEDAWRYEYDLVLPQAWEGGSLGPNLDLAYEGFEERSRTHRFRLGVLRHWP